MKRCRRCGAGFVSPQPTDTAIAGYFEKSRELTRKESELKFETNRAEILARVIQCIESHKSGGTLLDVGCATGFFMKGFLKKSNWQVRGVELSQSLAKRAAQRGFQIDRGTIHSIRYPAGSFDMVTVLDGFYYFPQPHTDLAEISRILKPEGLVVLELPLAGSRIWRKSARLGRLLSATASTLLQSSDHLFYYTPKSISFLLQQCGFQVKQVLPLPGNAQDGRVQNFIYKSYFHLSLIAYYLTLTQVFLGPRFLVFAQKA